MKKSLTLLLAFFSVVLFAADRPETVKLKAENAALDAKLDAADIPRTVEAFAKFYYAGNAETTEIDDLLKIFNGIYNSVNTLVEPCIKNPLCIPLNATERAEIAAFLERTAPFTDAAAKKFTGAGLKYKRDFSEVWSMPLNEITVANYFMKAEFLRGRMAAESGDAKTAFSAFERIAAVRAAFAGDVTLISALVRGAILEKEVALASLILRDCRLDKAGLERLLSHFEKAEKTFPAETLRALKGETAFITIGFDNVMKWKGDQEILRMLYSCKLEMILYMNDLRSDRAVSLKYMLDIIDRAAVSFVSEPFMALDKKNLPNDAIKTKAGSFMNEAMPHSVAVLESNRALLRLAQLGVRVKLYALAHDGKLPARLSDLEAGNLAIDPFSGAEYVYRSGDCEKTVVRECDDGEYEYAGVPVRGFALESKYSRKNVNLSFETFRAAD